MTEGYQDDLGYNHWHLFSIRQVSGSIFRWEGSTESFVQEECYHIPDVVKMEFQAAQSQLAWLASRGQETSDHVVSVEWELKRLWVAVRLEQKYIRHLIKEHLAPLQRSSSSTACQCAIVGDFKQSPIPTSFQDLHSLVLIGPGSPPPLKSCSSKDSFDSFWEELNTIIEAEVSPVQQEGGSLHEAEGSDEEASEEAWEDINSCHSGGGSSGREDVS